MNTYIIQNVELITLSLACEISTQFENYINKQLLNEIKHDIENY